MSIQNQSTTTTFPFRKKMEVGLCRVCLEASEAMVNIFDIQPNESLSIADMISQCTGFPVSRGDAMSETICTPCLLDAQNAFEVKQLYESSHRFFCQAKENLQRKKDLLGKEIIETVSEKVEVTTEVIEKEFVENGELRDVSIVQVKNEPIEDDLFEEEPQQSSDFDFYEVDYQVKSEECEDNPNQSHEDNNSNEEKNEKCSKQSFQCSQCQKSFTHKGNFLVHTRTHTGERPYKCPHCEKSYTQMVTLRCHIRTHTGERPFKCPECQKGFYLQRHLNEHILCHEAKRSLQCAHCPKSFTQKKSLEIHIRTHTYEQHYECSHCQETFSNLENLQMHMRTHMGKAVHKCSYCQKCFTHKGNYTEHLLTHTGDKPYKCSHCQQSFSRKKCLQMHSQTHIELGPTS